MNQIREMVERVPVRKRGRDRVFVVATALVVAPDGRVGIDFGLPLQAGKLEPLPDEPLPPPWRRRERFTRRTAFRGRR